MHYEPRTKAKEMFSPFKSLLIFADWREKVSRNEPLAILNGLNDSLLTKCLELDIFNPFLNFDQMLRRHQGLLVDYDTIQMLVEKI